VAGTTIHHPAFLSRQGPPRAAARGFTLLEMLVALAMVGLLSAALYMSLSAAMRARSRAEAAIGPARAAALALEMLKQDLEAAPPPRGVLAGALVGVDSTMASDTAQGDTLVFYTTAEDAGQRKAGIRRIELLFEPADGEAGYALVRAVTDNLLAPQTPDPVKETLCRKVAAFNLRYYDGSSWQDSWDSTTTGNTLPLAVEAALTVYTPDGEKEALAVSTRNSSATSASTTAMTYKLTRVMALPCGATPEEAPSTPPSSQ